MSRPGVATTMSVPKRKAFTCGDIDTPPTIVVTRSCTDAPYVASALCTCMASSRVGTSTSPSGLRVRAGRRGTNRRSIIGSAKAAVLPVPVCARASRSDPFNTRGMDADWTGVGSV